MRGAFVILIAMIVIGVILYVTDVMFYRKKQRKTHDSVPSTEDKPVSSSDAETEAHGDFCCGKHLICEKKELQAVTKIVYYDDEELDRFRGRESDSYTSKESDEFRDILITLLPQDVAGWARSIQLREINLPSDIKEELLLILSEQHEDFDFEK